MRRPRPALASTVMTSALLAGCADVPRPVDMTQPYQQSILAGSENLPQSYAERWSVSWCGVQQAWIVFDVMTPAGRDTRAFKTVDRPR